MEAVAAIVLYGYGQGNYSSNLASDDNIVVTSLLNLSQLPYTMDFQSLYFMTSCSKIVPSHLKIKGVDQKQLGNSAD